MSNNAHPVVPASPAGSLFVLCGAIFLEGLDVAMLNVALPAIRAELGLSTTTLSAVVSAYVLGYAGFLLLGGRVADLLGKRRVFLVALGVFILFSGLGGFAQSGWMLLLARFVTGVAAAFMTPAGLALITTSFEEGPRRDRAILIYAGTASAGFSLGLVVGGVLAAADWRWIFFAPVILGGVLFLLTPRYILADRTGPRREAFDVAGALALTAAMLASAWSVIRLENPSQGWFTSLGLVVVAAAAWAGFGRLERRAASPLVRPAVLSAPMLWRANMGAATFAAAFFGFTFLVTLYLQELRGWSALQTGLALIVISIDAVLAPLATPWFVRRFGKLRVIVAGMVLAATAYGLFLGLRLDWAYAMMFPSMLLLGMGFALAYGPLTILATDGVEEADQGLAGGLVNTAFQFGAALGLSGASAVGVLALGTATGADARLEAMRLALLVPVAATLLGILVMCSGAFARPRSVGGSEVPARGRGQP